MNESSGEVFDQTTFYPRLDIDLSIAKSEAKLLSAFVSVARIDKIAITLTKLCQRGVRVCAFVQEPWDWKLRSSESLNPSASAHIQQFMTALRYLQQLGVHVNLREEIHMKVAVIDNCILWDGSLNILSYSSTKERMTRWFSPEKAIEALAEYKLHQCRGCTASRNQITTLNLSPESAGKAIANRREELRISQRRLSSNLQISRTTLSAIESGKASPNLELFFKISKALGKNVAWIPPDSQQHITKILEQFQPSVLEAKTSRSSGMVQQVNLRDGLPNL